MHIVRHLLIGAVALVRQLGTERHGSCDRGVAEGSLESSRADDLGGLADWGALRIGGGGGRVSMRRRH